MHKHARWISTLADHVRAPFRGPRADSGATAVEFALIVPMFFALLFGVLEFGRLIFTQGVLFYATEEATRYAIVNYQDSPAVVQSVAESKFILISPGKITSFSVTAPVDPEDQTKLVTVEIGYQFEFLFPFVGDGPITMTASTRGFLSEEF